MVNLAPFSVELPLVALSLEGWEQSRPQQLVLHSQCSHQQVFSVAQLWQPEVHSLAVHLSSVNRVLNPHLQGDSSEVVLKPPCSLRGNRFSVDSIHLSRGIPIRMKIRVKMAATIMSPWRTTRSHLLSVLTLGPPN